MPDVVGPEGEARETDGTDGCMRRALLERLITLDSPSATTFRGRIHVAVRALDRDCCGDAPPAGIIYVSTANPFERSAWTRVVFQDEWGASRDAPVRLFAREPIAGEPDSGYLDAFYLEARPGRVRSVRKWSE